MFDHNQRCSWAPLVRIVADPSRCSWRLACGGIAPLKSIYAVRPTNHALRRELSCCLTSSALQCMLHQLSLYCTVLIFAEVNYFLLVLCLAVVAGFQSGTAIGNAYGKRLMLAADTSSYQTSAV